MALRTAASGWTRDDGWSVRIFDQTKLPWALDILRLTTVAQAAHAIRRMQVRGAPLIGAVAAYGVCLALRADASDAAMERDARTARRHPPDRGEFALGDRAHAGPAAPAPRRRAGRRRLCRGRPHRRRGRGANARRSAGTAPS